MRLLYNLGIKCYLLIIHIWSLKNNKATKWIQGRKNWEENLKSNVKENNQWIWFHCSSLGEYEDSCEILDDIQHEFPSYKTILTIFSPSAFDILSGNKKYEIVTYLPIDTPKNATKFLDIVQPSFVLFSRSELWFHFLSKIHSRKIPLFLLSLRLNKNSNFLKWPMRNLYTNCFHNFSHIFCQDAKTISLLQQYFNINKSTIIGNTRIARIIKSSQEKFISSELETFISTNFVIVVGSSLRNDERYMLKAYKELQFRPIKWIIIPHELDHSLMTNELLNNPDSFISFSDIHTITSSHKVIVVDKIGILKHLYQYAHLVIVGGGFNSIGIHNILEPAIYGHQILIGPNHRNYSEAIELLDLGGVKIFHNEKELTNYIEHVIKNPTSQELNLQVKNYVLQHKSDTKKVVEKIKSIVSIHHQ